MLSSSPHDLRENRACQSFLWGRFGCTPRCFETLRNPQQNTTDTCARPFYISSTATSTNFNPRGILDFRRGRGTSPDGIDRLTAQAEKYTGTRLPRCGKACGLPYHEAPSSRRLYGGTKNHADDSKARPPDFFHPLLLHDDIRHATGSADALPSESPDFSDRLSDVMRDHICSQSFVSNKVACLAARRSCPRLCPPLAWSVCPLTGPLLSCLPALHAGVASNRRSWGC